MKQIVNARKAVASAGMMVAFSVIGFAQCKIAIVDMLAAVVDSNEGKAQAPKFDARVKEWSLKLNIIQSEISKAQKQLNGQSARIPEDSDAVLQRRIQEKTSELTRMQSDAQKDVDNYRDSLLGPIKKVVAETAKTVATEKGIASVVDTSAPLTAPLPAGGGKDCDITSEVITRMNAKSGGDTPAK
jgi:Skp family chaperone for outer membrane proteins